MFTIKLWLKIYIVCLSNIQFGIKVECCQNLTRKGQKFILISISTVYGEMITNCAFWQFPKNVGSKLENNQKTQTGQIYEFKTYLNY